jgi:hypothetical protein
MISATPNEPELRRPEPIFWALIAFVVVLLINLTVFHYIFVIADIMGRSAMHGSVVEGCFLPLLGVFFIYGYGVFQVLFFAVIAISSMVRKKGKPKHVGVSLLIAGVLCGLYYYIVCLPNALKTP